MDIKSSLHTHRNHTHRTTGRALALCIASVFAFSVYFSTAQAATLRLNADASSVSAGESITLNIVLNSEGVAVNNAEATIAFPTDMFDILSISKSGSIFSLWVEEPYFSNTTGVITLNGGVPTPGFNGSNGPVVSIVAKAKKKGQAEFVFSNASVRANDGLGTDVLSSKQGKIITITDKAAPAPVEDPIVEVKPSPVSTVTLNVNSPTHPNQDQWYKDVDPLLRWNLPGNVDAVQTAMDTSSRGLPRVTYSPAIEERVVKNVKDGIWYFKVRARTDGAWGPVSTYITRVDTTSPVKKDVSFTYDNAKRILTIHSQITDETSGLDHYEIFINGVLIETVPARNFVNGIYTLNYKTPGDSVVRLVAVDHAGNSVDATGNFYVAEKPSVKPPVQPEQVQVVVQRGDPLEITIGSFTAPFLYVALLLISVVGLLMLIAFSFGRGHSRTFRKLRVHSAFDSEEHNRALAVLKKRLERHLELLHRTRQDRILSREEKEMKEAIEGDLDDIDRMLSERKGE